MGVYINMEMPTSCGYCPLRHEARDGDECYLGASLTEYQKRPDDCPLVPVPKHGKLGDLDRLAKEVEDMGKEFPPDSIGAERYRLFAEFIKTAPTILEAEEGET